MKTRFVVVAIISGIFPGFALPVLGEDPSFGDIIRDQKIARAIGRLDDPEAYWRERSIWELRKLGAKTPEVIALLEKALDDDEFDVQEAAAKTLAQWAPETKRLRTLADAYLMSDESRHVRQSGYEIHRDIGNAIWTDIAALRAHFESGDWRRKRLAATLIDRSNNRNGLVKVYVPPQAEFTDDLAACLDDTEHEDLRRAAVAALEGLRHFSRPVLKRLVDHLDRELSREIRVEILRAVEAIGVPENYDAVPALIEVLLRDRDDRVRDQAAYALAIGWPSAKRDAVPALVRRIGLGERLSHPGSAARAIAEIDPEGEIALPLLLDLLDQPPASDTAWEYAFRAIENLGPALAGGAAPGRVREFLNHPNPVVSRAAASALLAMGEGDREAEIATLTRSLRAESEVRDDAIRSLGELGSPAAAAVLVDSLRDQRPIAMRHFQRAAEAGEPDGDFQLGMIYLNGPEPIRDDEKAVLHLTRAAEKGHGAGCGELGLLYLRGDLVERDVAVAESWFRRARTAREADEAVVEEAGWTRWFNPLLSDRFASHLETHGKKKSPAWHYVSEPDEPDPIFILTEIGIDDGNRSNFWIILTADGQCMSNTWASGVLGVGKFSPDISQLTPEAMKTIREFHASLPPSIDPVPPEDALLYSFHEPETEEWVTRVYHARALPDAIREIGRLTGYATPPARRDPRLILQTRTGRIAAGAFGPEGALTICGYRNVQRWSADGREIPVPQSYDRVAFAIADDASRLVQYGSPSQFLSGADFKPVSEFSREGYFRYAAFSENTSFLGFFHSTEETIESYEVTTGERVARFLHAAPHARCVAVSDDGRTLAGLKSRDGNNSAILIYRAGQPEPVVEIGDFIPPPGPNGAGRDTVVHLRFLDGDPNRLLIVTEKRVVRWDIGEGRALSEFEFPPHSRIVAASPTGKFAAAVWDRKRPQLWVWDTETGQRLAALDGIEKPASYDDYPDTIIFSRDERRIAAWNEEGRLVVWNLGAED